MHPFAFLCQIPLGQWGPVPFRTEGVFFLAEVAFSLKGVSIRTGVIDEDSAGELPATMTVALEWTFKKGDKIAQLLLLLCVLQKRKMVSVRDWAVPTLSLPSAQCFLSLKGLHLI